MLINECRYFFYNEDRVTTRCFDRIISITDDKEVTKELIWGINNMVINKILEIYPELKADGYHGHVRLYDEDYNMKFVTYEYNNYEIDNILKIKGETYNENEYKHIKDHVNLYDIYNGIKKINTIGKTYQHSYSIFLCDEYGIVNHLIFFNMLENTCCIYKLFKTEDFSNIIKSVNEIIDLGGTYDIQYCEK